MRAAALRIPSAPSTPSVPATPRSLPAAHPAPSRPAPTPARSSSAHPRAHHDARALLEEARELGLPQRRLCALVAEAQLEQRVDGLLLLAVFERKVEARRFAVTAAGDGGESRQFLKRRGVR